MRTTKINKDFILANVIGEVVSKDSDKITSDMVTHEFLDLALIYRVKLECDEEDGIASAVITNNHLKAFNITEEELFEVVSNNCDFEYDGLYRTITKYLGLDEEDIPADPNEPIVVTTPDKFLGASVLVSKFLEQLREKFDVNFYCIPCSRHEIIILKDNFDININDIKFLIETVNQTELKPEDKLSDSLYYYSNRGLSQVA